ncbi:SDR family NAD(P)-dependent oxidoreductase [Acuticoccus mangrovi]|uniref:SDR family oxidoreductase n=1 Tax=Acuticoccus mangrovi TaxID=2796142 RepID=A0A934ID23_9HYPH|nr:SDR family oxidoreductase [Acuticoccus mangrovi]MBJ3774318.1 SDR family oxidoreductase [Acuticoccus mangrovi]
MTQKIALITGGSRGLGRNAALHLARHGVDVILTYNSRADEAEAAVAEVEAAGARAVALQLNTGDTSTFPAFVATLKETLEATFGRDTIDFLVNNAGTGLHKTFAETTEAEFDVLMNIHLKGVFFLTQALLPVIVDGGRIVNLSTGLTRFTLGVYAAYASMKGAVEVLTRYLARELGPRGITVNAIAPGATATDFAGGAVRDNPAVNQMVKEATAMGRVGQPDDIGGAIASLLTGENGWVTGQRIEASGGQSL